MNVHEPRELLSKIVHEKMTQGDINRFKQWIDEQMVDWTSETLKTSALEEEKNKIVSFAKQSLLDGKHYNGVSVHNVLYKLVTERCDAIRRQNTSVAMDIPSLRQIAAHAFAKAISAQVDDPQEMVESLLTFPPAYLKNLTKDMPLPGLLLLWQSGKFTPYLRSEALNNAVQFQENRLRQLFATNPKHKELNNPLAGLYNVYSTSPFGSNVDLFRIRDWGLDFFDNNVSSSLATSATSSTSSATSSATASTSSTSTRMDKKETKEHDSEEKSNDTEPSPAKEDTEPSPAPPSVSKMILFAEGNIPPKSKSGKPSATLTLSGFVKNFNVFTTNALVELDWSNVLCAGGCCTACLLPVKEAAKTAAWFNPTKVWEMHRLLPSASDTKSTYDSKKLDPFTQRSKSHKSRDVDLFLYGLNEQEALEKIRHIHDVIIETAITPPLVVVNGKAITFYREFPHRSIQVVTRLYKSPSEILLGFDLDSACVGYNGSEVFCAPRTIRAFNTRCNVVDMTRRSLSYEARLFKYAKRNFAVLVPGIRRNDINPIVYDHFSMGRTQKIIGLKRLLM